MPGKTNRSPISELDIYRSAQILIHRFREDAAIEAALRADQMSIKGDIEGKAVWVRILRAIDILQAKSNRDFLT